MDKLDKIKEKIVPRKQPILMPDQPELTELLTKLQVTKRDAGNPSLRAIARRTQPTLSLSTVSRVFKAAAGTPAPPPKWDNLEAVLRTLGVNHEQLTEYWHPLWVRAMNEANPLQGVDPSTGSVLPTGLRTHDVDICNVCGAWVAEPDQHRDWHRTFETMRETFERYLAPRQQYPTPRLASSRSRNAGRADTSR